MSLICPEWSEWVNSLIGTIVGGLFALAGAFFAVRWQAKENIKALAENAGSIFGYILEAQLRHLNEVVEWHTIDQNSVPTDALLRLDGIIEIFDREHNRLAYISRDGRTNIRDAVYDVKRWVFELRKANIELQNARTGLGYINGNLGKVPVDDAGIEKMQKIVSGILDMATDLKAKSDIALEFLNKHGKKQNA